MDFELTYWWQRANGVMQKDARQLRPETKDFSITLQLRGQLYAMQWTKGVLLWNVHRTPAGALTLEFHAG